MKSSGGIKLKKILAILILLILLTVCASCYYGWKTIEVDGVGSFKVPKEWIYTVENGLVYLTDKPIDEEDYSIYFIEPIVYLDREKNTIISHKLFGKAKYMDSLEGKVLSNLAFYGQEEYELTDGTIIIKYFVSFYSEHRDFN